MFLTNHNAEIVAYVLLKNRILLVIGKEGIMINLMIPALKAPKLKLGGILRNLSDKKDDAIFVLLILLFKQFFLFFFI